MAPHSSTLAWKIPWTEEPGRLQSMGSLRVRHDLAAKQQHGNEESMLCYATSRESCPTLCNPIDGSPSGFPSLGFSRQEHWSGLPFPSPGDLPDPEIEPGFPALQADDLPTELCYLIFYFKWQIAYNKFTTKKSNYLPHIDFSLTISFPHPRTTLLNIIF